MLNSNCVEARRSAMRRIALRAGIGAIAVLPLVAAPAAHASFVNQLDSNAYAIYPATYVPKVCPAHQVSSGPLSCDVIDSVLQVESFATAYDDASGLHAAARTTFSIQPSAVVSNSAYSQLDDVFTFTGPHPSQAVVTVVGNVVGNSNTQTFLTLSGFMSIGAGCDVRGTGLCTAYETFSPENGFSLELYEVAVALAGGNDSRVQEARVDAYISSLTFTDLAGNPLALAYTTQSGAVYPPAVAVSTVPEPNGLLLVLPFALAGFALYRAHVIDKDGCVRLASSILDERQQVRVDRFRVRRAHAV